MSNPETRIRQLERGYDELRTVNNRLQAQLAAAKHDIDAYRGALGYAVPGDHDGRLSDGSTPRCGICEVLVAQLAEERERASINHALLVARLEDAERERDALLRMLAEWCVAVDNDSSWDGWDHHYKDARYRPGPMRDKLDEAIKEVQDEQARYDAALERKP